MPSDDFVSPEVVEVKLSFWQRPGTALLIAFLVFVGGVLLGLGMNGDLGIPDDLDVWEVYRNSVHGLSVSVPPGFDVLDNLPESVGQQQGPDTGLQLKNTKKEITVKLWTDASGWGNSSLDAQADYDYAEDRGLYLEALTPTDVSLSDGIFSVEGSVEGSNIYVGVSYPEGDRDAEGLVGAVLSSVQFLGLRSLEDALEPPRQGWEEHSQFVQDSIAEERYTDLFLVWEPQEVICLESIHSLNPAVCKASSLEKGDVIVGYPVLRNPSDSGSVYSATVAQNNLEEVREFPLSYQGKVAEGDRGVHVYTKDFADSPLFAIQSQWLLEKGWVIVGIVFGITNPEYTELDPSILRYIPSDDHMSTLPVDSGDIAGWNTYTSESGIYSFDYPGNWYSDKYVESSRPEDVSFFIEGIAPDHSFGDHKGNEVFNISYTIDSRTLTFLKEEYYPDAQLTVVGGKPALRTSFDLFIVKLDATKQVSIVGGDASDALDEILTTFEFIED